MRGCPMLGVSTARGCSSTPRKTCGFRALCGLQGQATCGSPSDDCQGRIARLRGNVFDTYCVGNSIVSAAHCTEPTDAWAADGQGRLVHFGPP